MKLRRVYPFTLWANIGTCITALLAALALSGDGAIFGLQIAFVHLFFNLFGVIFIYGMPVLRRFPMIAASSLARLASRRRIMAAVYVIGVFFVLPLLCLGIYKMI
jgi:sodium-dependent phosphate cotransporter